MIAAVPQRVRPGLDPAAAASGGRSPVRKAIRFLLILAAAWLGSWPALAGAGPAPAVALSHRVEHLKAAFSSGDPAALRTAVQEVELLRRTYGTLDVSPLVDAMALYARQLGDRGQPELGLQVLRTLDRWGSGDPTLLGARVVLLRQQGLRGYLWSLADVLELTRMRLADPAQRWLWAFQHLAPVRPMVTLLLWGWALTLVLRYRKVFRNQWEEPLLRRGWHPWAAACLGALLMTFPVVLGLDPSVAAMLWLWLLAPFLLPVEARITVLLLLLQWVHPALGLVEPLATRRPGPSVVTLQLRPQPLALDPRIWAALAPADRDFLTGWRQLQAQDWPRAEATFQTLVAAGHPDQDAVLNNLGVARFQQGDLEGARSCFDQAGALRESPEILLNQSVVAFREMDSSLGSAKQEEASRVDPDAINRMVTANHARKDQRTFPTPLPDSPARSRALAAASGPGGAGAAARVPGLAALINLLLPLLAAAAIRLRIRNSVSAAHPSQCVRCGDPFHTTDCPDPMVCSRCHHLFNLKDGLHGDSRKRQVDEAAAFQRAQRRLHRLLVACLPGAGRCFLGDTRGGFLEYGCFCFALGVVLTMGRPFQYPGEILPDPGSIWLPVGLALLALLGLRSWLKLLPRRA